MTPAGPRASIAAALTSADGLTEKFAVRLADGAVVETVLMRYRDRRTACLSTQVGCAMGCVFCATGQMGFRRHMTAPEITAQVELLNEHLAATGERLRNVVLMGMGEPLHNYDAVVEALDTLADPRRFGIAPRHTTLSTVGIVPGILRLAEERRPVRLAVSLHAATDAERQALLPAARRWPLHELLDACRTYATRLRRKVFFEWTLIAGRTDAPAQAERLGALLHGLDAQVNVIPLNPTSSYDGSPSDAAAVDAFRAILARHGVPSSVRQRRGIDVDAGCGQLAARAVTAA